jgi:hypothetical protein
MLELAEVRELHLPSTEHGVALCGRPMLGKWACGPLAYLYRQCEHVCETCFERATVDGAA